MHTATTIHIAAGREQVFDTVSDLSRWPALLPHYRFVRSEAQQGNHEIVRMGATRSGIPISWVSAYVADRDSLELRFEHLRAWTKGMRVVWKLTPTFRGTRVEILHDLSFRIGFLGWLVEPILGHFFIDHIARKTLETFKDLIENAPSREP